MYLAQAEGLIKKHEGLCLKPYQCPAGKWTIGYGRNLEDTGITPAEADTLLKNDVQRCYRECLTLLCWKKLNETRQAVLINMCFNLGLARLKTFKKMLAALEQGYFERAAYEMLNSKWAAQVGYRAMELAELMKKGA